MEQTKQLLPSQIGCIDLEWLIGEIEKVNNGLISSTEVLQYLLNNTFPLTPLLKDAWEKGFPDAMLTDCQHLENYINTPIKISKDEQTV
jgi:hypothetical protein